MVVLRYRPSRPRGRSFLVAEEGTSRERRFPFRDRIEIGRFEVGSREDEGKLLIEDPTVSARHCLVVRNPEGRFFVRDTSRNGTRLDGRRLLPNRETEFRPGQVLAIGSATFRLLECSRDHVESLLAARPGTMAAPCTEEISVVVGDIRGYTRLLETSEREVLQRAVSRVFAQLGAVVHDLGGEIKEYQGDSLLAFWESMNDRNAAVAACRAAILLHHRVQDLARDPEIWPLPRCSLDMDWAVTTGHVSIHVFGENGPEELSMVGEPIVLAYRMEKFADKDTGPLLVCARTREKANTLFEFEALGPALLPGFEHPVDLFRLVKERPQPDVALAEGRVP